MSGQLQSDGGYAPDPRRACEDPVAPRRFCRGARCAASIRRGYAPNPRRSLAGTPSPRAASAEARGARHQSDGATPRTPGVRLRGPRRPAPLLPRRAVRGINQTGLRPEPPAFACGDPVAPRRFCRGARCAASIRRGYAPNPRRSLAGTPSPRAAPAEARCARHQSDGATPRTPGVRLRGPRRPAPLPPRRAVRALREPARVCGAGSRCSRAPRGAAAYCRRTTRAARRFRRRVSSRALSWAGRSSPKLTVCSRSMPTPWPVR